MKTNIPAKISKEAEDLMADFQLIQNQLAPILAEQAKILEKLSELKPKLKEYAEKNNLPDGKYSGSIPRFVTKLGTQRRVVCEDVSKITDESLIKEVEIDNIIERDGKYYQKVGNVDAFKEQYLKLGIEDVAGFKVNKIKTISFTADGKVVPCK